MYFLRLLEHPVLRIVFNNNLLMVDNKVQSSLNVDWLIGVSLQPDPLLSAITGYARKRTYNS